MLRRRKSVFTSRVHVPADLVHLIGRREVLKSLRTSEQREARLRERQWQAHMAAMFGHLRRDGRRMDREQIDKLVSQYLSARFCEIEERLAVDVPMSNDAGREKWRDDLYESLARTERQLAEGDFSETLPAAQELLGHASSIAVAMLSRRLLEAKHEAICAEIDASQGRPFKRLITSIQGVELIGRSEPVKATPPLSEVIESYTRAKIQAKKWTPKTAQLNGGRLQTCLELMGDKPIGEYSPDDMEQLQARVQQVPTNSRSIYRDDQKKPVSVVEAIKLADATANADRLAVASVILHMDVIKSVFIYAHKKRIIERSPADGLEPLDDEEAKRKPFSDDDLKLIFGSLKEDSEGVPSRWWIPHLLLFSGARLDEMAQLHAEDVREEHGVWILDINEEGPKKIKTGKFGARIVPVHSNLIAMGWIEYVKSIGEGHLFPELLWKEGEGYSGALSKWGGRRLRRLGIKDKYKVAFHSFRHTVATKLGSAGVDGQTIDKLQGWKSAGSSMRVRYVHEFEVKALKGAIEHLCFAV